MKYEEDFKLALESFAQASALDPTWQEPRGQAAVLIKYLQVVFMYLMYVLVVQEYFMYLMHLACLKYQALSKCSLKDA